MLTATLGTVVAVAIPTLAARVLFGPDLSPFIASLGLAAVLYVGLLRQRRVSLKLDQLIGDLRHRKVARAQA